ncbi:MAG TPA: LamG-like jellyroll fold domain-containing protein, partial [Verrucomicrobiae bacterium]|nr:LamG-like jellyroll fold domain-containing protein [Verrucomicrobiae bacterium]
VPANAALNSDEFTLGYFINLKGAVQGNSGLERLSSRSGNLFETAAGAAGAVGGTSSATGTTLSYYSPAIGWNVTHVELPADGWAHVAWHNTAEAMDLYLNGQLAFSGPPVPPGTLNGILNFGTRFDQLEGFQGLMDDAFLANGNLSAADIAAIAAQGINTYFGFGTDTDKDGLPDWWETDNNLSATDNGSSSAADGPAGDPDNDNLTNDQEFARGTSPREKDSDGDTLEDGAEVTQGTNPLLADTDGDGLADANEATRKTNPLKADTDGDLISDGDEITLGTNPLDPLSGPSASAFLVLHLNFDGDVQDSSPAGNHGTLKDAPEFRTDTPLTGGQALALSGNGMGVEIPGSDTLAANAFTLAYWVKPTALQEGQFERLTSRGGYAFETAVGPRDAGPLTLSYYQTGAWFSTGVSLPLDDYTHVTFRNRGSGPQDLDVFINGKLVYTGLGVPATGPGNGLMSVGNAFNSQEGFEGLIDEVRLYRAPLSNADIAALVAPSDTDKDGLPDWWEATHKFSPTDDGSTNAVNGGGGDPDNDGLPNSQEFARQTDPRVEDSDGDGLLDGTEVTRGTNPLAVDSDKDGLEDKDEVTRGTNPLLIDTDADGISDSLEVETGTNPLDPLSGLKASEFLVLHLDFDGDLLDNSSKGNNGSPLSAPEFVNDTPLSSGKAIAFTSNDMGVTIEENDSLAANQFTLAYWVKPTTLQEGGGLERLTSRAGDQFETAIGNASGIGGGVPDLTLSYYPGNAWIKTSITLKLNEWSHVAWRNRGTGPRDLDLLVNGRVVFTGSGVPASGPGSGLMNIGTRHNSLEGFEGLMDDVRLYRAPIKDADIAALVGSLSISKVVRAANGASVSLTFSSQAGRVYSIERSTDLNTAVWAKLTETLPSAGSETTYSDTSAGNVPRAFYRVRQLAP